MHALANQTHPTPAQPLTSPARFECVVLLHNGRQGQRRRDPSSPAPDERPWRCLAEVIGDRSSHNGRRYSTLNSDAFLLRHPMNQYSSLRGRRQCVGSADINRRGCTQAILRGRYCQGRKARWHAIEKKKRSRKRGEEERERDRGQVTVLAHVTLLCLFQEPRHSRFSFTHM